MIESYVDPILNMDKSTNLASLTDFTYQYIVLDYQSFSTCSRQYPRLIA